LLPSSDCEKSWYRPLEASIWIEDDLKSDNKIHQKHFW